MKLELLSGCLKYTDADLVPRQGADLCRAHAGKTEVFGSNSMTFQQHIKGLFYFFQLKEFWHRAFAQVKGLLHIKLYYSELHKLRKTANQIASGYLLNMLRFLPTNVSVSIPFSILFYFSDIKILYLFFSGRKLISKISPYFFLIAFQNMIID